MHPFMKRQGSKNHIWHEGSKFWPLNLKVLDKISVCEWFSDYFLIKHKFLHIYCKFLPDSKIQIDDREDDLRLKAEFSVITVISEYQDFLTMKTFMGFLMLIFVISTHGSINKHMFYMDLKKKNFSWSLWGTPGSKIFFVSFLKIDLWNMFRVHI